MIRPARFADIPGLIDLGLSCMAAGRYHGTSLNVEAAKGLLIGAITSHKPTPEIGSTPVFVADHDGLTGFIIGSYQPAYMVLDEMVVSHLIWWVDHSKAQPSDGWDLMEALHEWAGPVRQCHAINDAVMRRGVLRRMFLQKGYRECGHLFEKEAEK